MTSKHGCTQARALAHLQQAVDDCMARDIPSLRKRCRGLQKRCRRGEPVDRGIEKLASAIEASRSAVEKRISSLPEPEYQLTLPVVERREEILELIAAHQVIVLCGETGSGKTTQLPKLCLEMKRGTRGRIGHTQPRRLAARSLAGRIAEELHSPLGGQVGFKVRFYDRVQDNSYIKIMTDGILLAEIQSDPELREYDTLIIDEAHERSLNIDFLLGYLRRLLPRRPDLKLIITSATIDPQRFSEHFDNAPIIEVSGRTYPVDIRYRPLAGEDEDHKDRGREQALLDAVDELAAEGPGDILIFLPGERAIREVRELLRKHHPPHTEILPLFARLSVAEQNQVFKPHKGRRIVLATNVAETSLTVPGIHYVIDVGQARISRYSYRTKVQRLPVEAVSQASANQRSGRCGRVAAGVCIRLYSEEDFVSRAEFTEAEIQRTNLAAVILQMATLGLGDVEVFPFVDPPDPRFVRDGYKLLNELGAVDESNQLTALGRKIARLPLDPRLARMILAASDNQCLHEVLIIASALEVMDPRDRPLDRAQAADEKHALFKDERSDFLGYINLWQAFAEQARHLSNSKLRGWCRQHFISYMRMREWLDVHRQLQAEVHAMGMRSNKQEADYQAIHTALLTGLLGNIACQVEAGEYLGARNLKFSIFPGSALRKRKPKWVMAAELVETGQRYLRTAAVIDPAWVEPLAQALVKRSYAEPHWEKRRAQVVAYETVTLYGLPLVQRRKVEFSRVDPTVSRELFIRHALVLGEFNTPFAFAEYNRILLGELEQLEAKSRRRDVLVDEEVIYAFFDERLPDSIIDAKSFVRWWKKEQQKQPHLLNLNRALLMRHTAEGVTEAQFPDYLEIRGIRLPVEYRFSPGNEDDGLRVRLPLVALNQLANSDFDWLVPGMLKEKCTLLIKSLPKPLRRHFVPAPDFAQACLQSLDTPPEGGVSKFLQVCLRKMTGVEIPDDAWRVELLPTHLTAYFELFDGNRRLAGGRDLQRLQERFGERAHRGFTGIKGSEFERSDIRDWDFGDLPDYIELDQDGIAVRGYPALTVNDGRVDLHVFDQVWLAEQAHQEGLLALLQLKLGRSFKDILKSVPAMDKQALWFSTVANTDTLRSDLQRAVLQATFFGERENIRKQAQFDSVLEKGRSHLLSNAVEIGTHSYQVLEAYHQLRTLLKGGLSPQLLAAVGEIREQIEQLVYPGFLASTPPGRLRHLARYLRAAMLRLENLPGHLARDREASATVRRYWQRYQQARSRGLESPALEEFRWMIEELRVSLFAQSLGTAEKISPQRLDRLWRDIDAG